MKSVTCTLYSIMICLVIPTLPAKELILYIVEIMAQLLSKQESTLPVIEKHVGQTLTSQRAAITDKSCAIISTI